MFCNTGQDYCRKRPTIFSACFTVSVYTVFFLSLFPCLCMSSVKQIAVRTAWHPSWQRVIWQQRRKSSWKRKTLQFGNWQAIVTDRDCMPSMASPIAAKASRSQPLTASLNLSGNRRQSAQSPVPCSQLSPLASPLVATTATLAVDLGSHCQHTESKCRALPLSAAQPKMCLSSCSKTPVTYRRCAH